MKNYELAKQIYKALVDIGGYQLKAEHFPPFWLYG